MSRIAAVLVTRSFELHLGAIEGFLDETDAPGHFDTLLDTLHDVVIPNLERHPGMGRDFLARPAQSVEAASQLERLVSQLEMLDPTASLREYVTAQHLVLYAHIGDTVHLLAIRHHRQLSFDFESLGMWSSQGSHP